MPRRLSLVALALAVLVAPWRAALACEVRLGAVQAPPIAYDPFELGSANGSLSIDVELVDGDTCDALIALTDAGGTPLREFRFVSGGRSVALRGELRETGNVHPAGTPDSVRVQLSPAAPRAQLFWRLLSSEDAVLPPGDLTLDVIATPSLALGSSAPSRGTLTLRSLPRAQANLAGASGSFDRGSQAQTVDFGTLVTGAQRQMFLQVRANVPAHLAFSSANRGFLVNEADGRSRVPYGVAFEGQPLALAAPDRRDVTAPLTINGTSFPLTVTIGDVSGALAGRYSDTLSIEVSP